MARKYVPPVRRRKKGASSSSKISLIRQRERKTDRMLNTIRALALKEQRAKPQVFLSLREAADRFGTKTSAMATVYRQLTQEGILIGIRGSHTMLAGTGGGRTLKVRGLIGIPVSSWRFTSLRDYRDCFLHTRDELLGRGFATRCIFFEQRQPDPHQLVRRLSIEKVDTVLWFLPDGSGQETALRLRDRGIPLIGVSFATLPGIFCRYQVRRRDAIRGILRSWRSDPKISAATIVRARNETTADTERVKRLQDLAEAEQVESEIVTLPECGVAAFWQLLCADVTRGALLLAPAASMLAKHEPEMVAGVLNTCRVALIDGPLDLPVTEETSGATIDLVTVDWAPIAKRIADDTLTGDALTKSDPVVFEAKHRLQVRLDAILTHGRRPETIYPLSG